MRQFLKWLWDIGPIPIVLTKLGICTLEIKTNTYIFQYKVTKEQIQS